MATLNLQAYGNSDFSTRSYVGYSTKSGGYTLTSAAGAAVGTGDTGYYTVAQLISGDGKVNVKLSDMADNIAAANLTGIETGSDKAWSIVGGEEDAAITTITTGSKADVVKMAAIGEGASINVGDGNDLVSVESAAGSLTVDLGAGSDEASLTAVNGSLTVNAGDGANTVSIGTASSTLNYSGGTGSDVVSVASVAQDATISLGDGHNSVSVTSAAASLTVDAGSGIDSVNVGTVEGTGVINVGDGNNFVSVATANSTLQISAGAGKDSVSIGSVAKDATIALGDGADTLEIKGNVEGNLTITADGNAANLISVQGGKIDGNVAVNLGAGNDTVSLISTASIAGSISLGDGKDSVVLSTLEKATVTGGAGSKTISIQGAESANLTLGAGNDTVSLGAFTDSTVELGDGKDSLALEGALSGDTVNAGAGNDFVSVGGAVESSAINLGEGNDTITINTAAKMGDFTISGGAGKDVFSLGNGFTGTVTISDFEVGTDTLYGASGAAFTTGDAARFLSDGTVSLGGGSAKAAVNATGGFYAVTADFGGTAQNVAWAGESAATIDATSMTKETILIGSDNDAVSDTLLGGSKADSIFAGDNDYVYGGAGNDSIVLENNSEAAYVGFSKNGGKDVVENFDNGSTTKEADVVYLFENNISDISKITTTTGGTTTVLKMGTATLDIGNNQNFKLRDASGSDYKVTVVDNNTPAVKSVDNMANIYYAADDATTKTLDFSSVNDRLVVDLGNTGVVANTNNAQYYGKFNKVTGGKDETVLVGAAGNSESLVAGAGATTIWGGGSKSDTLVGYKGSGTAENSVMYVFGNGDGKDVVDSTNWGASDTNDVLWLNNASFESIKNNGTDTTISLTTGDKLTLKSHTDANKVIKYTTDGGATTSKVKVGKSGVANNFAYSEEVSSYIGGTGNTLTVGSDVDTANIWLDGSQGATYEGIKVVDAHNNSGDAIIAGTGANNESMVAGKGSSSMWGGAGSSNDTLVGTTGGTTTYFFGNGDGKDVITSSHSDDVVNLYNVALSDIATLDTTTTTMKITLNDGSALSINNMSSSSVKTFKLSDGSTWEYNSSSKSWTQA